MASILVFYDGPDPVEQQWFEEQCRTPENWGGTPVRIAPAAFKFMSANVNSIKIQKLARQCKTGKMRWVTVEDDEIREGTP